jgi:hypothetical protein
MEINRNPQPPKLSDRAIQLITKLCFRENDPPEKVDGIFVYASVIGIKALVNLIEKLLSENISNKIFITGGVTPKALQKDLNIESTKKEADIILQKINFNNYTDVEVFSEKKSTNTLDNVTETLKNPEFKKCESLLFIFKSHAAGRGYLTLRKFFPSAKILQQSFDTKYNQAPKKITRENWHTFDFGRKRVWGEFLRIKTYGSRGDIEYDEIIELITEIEKEISKK